MLAHQKRGDVSTAIHVIKHICNLLEMVDHTKEELDMDGGRMGTYGSEHI